MQTMIAPRSYAIAADTPVDVLATYKSPILLMQNNGGGVASVKFNDGVGIKLKANETYIFQMPIFGTIESDAAIVVLA